MTVWETLATELGHTDEKTMWEELYTRRKLSINQLSTKLACSPHTVRARLRACNIVIRKRGGPNSIKVEVTEDLLQKIRAHGVPKTAKILGVTPQTLYNRLYYKIGLKKRDLEKESTEPDDGTDNAESLQEPEHEE